jgi:hypothetical protein
VLGACALGDKREGEKGPWGREIERKDTQECREDDRFFSPARIDFTLHQSPYTNHSCVLFVCIITKFIKRILTVSCFIRCAVFRVS